MQNPTERDKGGTDNLVYQKQASSGRKRTNTNVLATLWSSFVDQDKTSAFGIDLVMLNKWEQDGCTTQGQGRRNKNQHRAPALTDASA